MIAQQTSTMIQNTKVYVSPLPLQTLKITQQDLRFVCYLCGKVKNLTIINKKALRKRAIDRENGCYYGDRNYFVFAYIEFADMKGKQRAKKHITGKVIGGKTINAIDCNYQVLCQLQQKKRFDRLETDTIYEDDYKRNLCPRKKIKKSEEQCFDLINNRSKSNYRQNRDQNKRNISASFNNASKHQIKATQLQRQKRHQNQRQIVSNFKKSRNHDYSKQMSVNQYKKNCSFSNSLNLEQIEY